MNSNTLPRVFIADHSPIVIERLIASIEDVAHVIGHATNARDTLAGIRSGNPQLILLDIAVDNGFDLLKQIQQHRPPVIVAVLTHSVDETTRRYCLQSGAAYFLDKLRDFDQVRRIVIAMGSGAPSVTANHAAIH